MTYLLGGAVVVFLGLLVYGGITGRVVLNSRCCCPADPDKDRRTRTYDDEVSRPGV